MRDICFSILLAWSQLCLWDIWNLWSGLSSKREEIPGRWHPSLGFSFVMPTWPIYDCAEGDCLENNTPDFDLMRLCPNQLQYFWMQFIMVVGLLLVALENRTVVGIHHVGDGWSSNASSNSINIFESKLFLQYFGEDFLLDNKQIGEQMVSLS